MVRSLKQLENDKILSEKLKIYHSKVKQLKEKESEIMNNIIHVEENAIDDVINDDSINEIQEVKRRRGRPKNSTKKNLIQV